MIENDFTRRWNLRAPIAQAGMAFAGMTPELAAGVASGGGLGSIAVGAAPAQVIDQYCQGFSDLAPGMPLNLNFITIFTTDEHIAAVCQAKPAVASFHWGHPKKAWIDSLQAAGVSVWEQVGDLASARLAVRDGIEVVVAQGTEAGGHNLATMPTMTFVPAVLDVVEGEAMVLAAGGIVDGSSLAAVLALGASGAWIGTRLVATPQSSAAGEYKDRVVAAKGSDTVLTSIFGPEHPDFNPMRVLRNEIVTEFEDKPQSVPTSLQDQPIVGTMDLLGQRMDLARFNNLVPMAGASGDFEQLPLLAGQGVGRVNAITDAAEVIRTMAADAEHILAETTKS